ncbi:MAG: hypothetical protein K5989_06570 [Lachnospiraceae bacterium]|nr:hypothetical protein [Lachnospiraceae bacterium]
MIDAHQGVSDAFRSSISSGESLIRDPNAVTEMDSSPDMISEIVATISRNESNDCCIAKRGTGDGSLCTLIVIRKRETVMELLEVLRQSEEKGQQSKLFESFSADKTYNLLFPYRTERPLGRFFVGEAFSLSACEEICMNIILSCISSGLPYPILYLILKQGKLNLAKDNSIYLSYDLDFSELDRRVGEKECAVACANILLEVLSTKSQEKNISYQLLSKKTANESYTHFTEIYRDIRIASTSLKKGSIIQRIKAFFRRNADLLFGILFWICVIAAIIALTMLLSHLVLGDIPILRLFYNSFKYIGTENLQQ